MNEYDTRKDTGHQSSASGDLSKVVTWLGDVSVPGGSLTGLWAGSLSFPPQGHFHRGVSVSSCEGGLFPSEGLWRKPQDLDLEGTCYHPPVSYWFHSPAQRGKGRGA